MNVSGPNKPDLRTRSLRRRSFALAKLPTRPSGRASALPGCPGAVSPQPRNARLLFRADTLHLASTLRWVAPDSYTHNNSRFLEGPRPYHLSQVFMRRVCRLPTGAGCGGRSARRVGRGLEAGPRRGPRTALDRARSSLDAKIEGVRSDLKALNSKFNFGFGLLVALLVAVIGILLGPTGRSGTTAPTPPITINFPTAFSPTALPMAPAAPTDSTAPQDQDIASIAADRGSSEPR